MQIWNMKMKMGVIKVIYEAPQSHLWRRHESLVSIICERPSFLWQASLPLILFNSSSYECYMYYIWYGVRYHYQYIIQFWLEWNEVEFSIYYMYVKVHKTNLKVGTILVPFPWWWWWFYCLLDDTVVVDGMIGVLGVVIFFSYLLLLLKVC